MINQNIEVETTRGADDTKEPSAPRLRVVKVNHQRKKKSRRNKRPKKENIAPIYSLEMQPVLRAAQEFGKMSAALGLKKGAEEIEKLANQIRALNPEGPLREILDDADRNAKILRNAYVAGYN